MEVKNSCCWLKFLCFFVEKTEKEARARLCFLCGGLCSIDENSWGGEGVARAVWME